MISDMTTHWILSESYKKCECQGPTSRDWFNWSGTSVFKAPRWFIYSAKFENHHFGKIILESVFLLKLEGATLTAQKLVRKLSDASSPWQESDLKQISIMEGMVSSEKMLQRSNVRLRWLIRHGKCGGNNCKIIPGSQLAQQNRQYWEKLTNLKENGNTRGETSGKQKNKRGHWAHPPINLAFTFLPCPRAVTPKLSQCSCPTALPGASESQQM